MLLTGTQVEGVPASPGDEDFFYLLSLILTTDLRVDGSIGLGLDIN